MSRMIEIKGKDVSEDTIVEALKKHCEFTEKYQAKPGDVAENKHGSKRIIVRDCAGKIFSVSRDGTYLSKKYEFECYGYRKIGKLKDIL